MSSLEPPKSHPQGSLFDPQFILLSIEGLQEARRQTVGAEAQDAGALQRVDVTASRMRVESKAPQRTGLYRQPDECGAALFRIDDLHFSDCGRLAFVQAEAE